MMPELKIGTRGSPLALAQAHETRERLAKAHNMDPSAFEVVVISTKGDRVQDRPLSEIGGKGLFTEELEAQLYSGDIDLAVHSTKDVPTYLPDGLAITTYLEREDPRDALIAGGPATLMSLRDNAIIGSASLRRQAIIRKLRPDITVITLRGNVQTRLRKLAEGQFDATLLAMAGLNRLGLTQHVSEALDPDDFIPAPGQGAICIEARENDTRVAQLLAPLHHEETAQRLAAERAFLAGLDGSCRTPIAAHAIIEGDMLHFKGMILTPDGKTSHITTRSGPKETGHAMGQDAADQLKQEAGSEFFSSWT